MVANSKWDWHRRIRENVWAYKNMHKMPTQLTPFALVYGVKVLQPLEL